MTHVLLMFAYPAATGMALGIFYYGSLWLILRRLPQFKYPALWVGLSLLLRTLVVVGVLYLLFAPSWQQLLVALLGMLIARALLVQYVKPGPRHAVRHTGPAP